MRARTLAGGVLAACLGGCAFLTPDPRATDDLLGKADSLAAQGQNRAAIAAYAEVVSRYPATPAAARARVLRDTLGTTEKLRADLRAREVDLRARDGDLRARDTELASVRRDLAAREADLVRAQSDVAARDLEVARLRSEVAARQADVARLSAEFERLRADLDQLKRIDMRLEQEGAKRR
jgi:TolA-binding protein